MMSHPSAAREIRSWIAHPCQHTIARFNRNTQLKILAIHALCAASLFAYRALRAPLWLELLEIAVLGLFALPFLRVFMHSQAHWRVGNGPIRNWLLDHCLSLPFSVSQTGYKFGHLAHHRYDNDADPRGLPRDLQSTYLFSRDATPTHIGLWVLCYVAVYQTAIHLLHTLNTGRANVIRAYFAENAAIAALHCALFHFARAYYVSVYLPALVLAWIVAALALYMMHAVPREEAALHPTIDCTDPFFNWFGDNDGYHLEHSLFPALHPVYLRRAHEALRPDHAQCIELNYVIAAIVKLLTGSSTLARTQPAPEVTP